MERFWGMRSISPEGVDLDPGQRLVTLRIHVTRKTGAEVRVHTRKSCANPRGPSGIRWPAKRPIFQW